MLGSAPGLTEREQAMALLDNKLDDGDITLTEFHELRELYKVFFEEDSSGAATVPGTAEGDDDGTAAPHPRCCLLCSFLKACHGRYHPAVSFADGACVVLTVGQAQTGRFDKVRKFARLRLDGQRGGATAHSSRLSDVPVNFMGRAPKICSAVLVRSRRAPAAVRDEDVHQESVRFYFSFGGSRKFQAH